MLNETQLNTLIETLTNLMAEMIANGLYEWLGKCIEPVDTSLSLPLPEQFTRGDIETIFATTKIPHEINEAWEAFKRYLSYDVPLQDQQLDLLKTYPNYNPFHLFALSSFISTRDYSNLSPVNQQLVLRLREVYLEMTPLRTDYRDELGNALYENVGQVPFNLDQCGTDKPKAGVIQKVVTLLAEPQVDAFKAVVEQLTRLKENSLNLIATAEGVHANYENQVVELERIKNTLNETKAEVRRNQEVIQVITTKMNEMSQRESDLAKENIRLRESNDVLHHSQRRLPALMVELEKIKSEIVIQKSITIRLEYDKQDALMKANIIKYRLDQKIKQLNHEVNLTTISLTARQQVIEDQEKQLSALKSTIKDNDTQINDLRDKQLILERRVTELNRIILSIPVTSHHDENRGLERLQPSLGLFPPRSRASDLPLNEGVIFQLKKGDNYATSIEHFLSPAFLSKDYCRDKSDRFISYECKVRPTWLSQIDFIASTVFSRLSFHCHILANSVEDAVQLKEFEKNFNALNIGHFTLGEPFIVHGSQEQIVGYSIYNQKEAETVIEFFSHSRLFPVEMVQDLRKLSSIFTLPRTVVTLCEEGERVGFRI